MYLSAKEGEVCDGLSVCLCICAHAVLHAVSPCVSGGGADVRMCLQYLGRIVEEISG